MNALLRAYGGTYVYVLHFMQSSVNKNNVVTVPSVTLNNVTYTNYAMPEDSIDFRVVERGRVTFMAGTFFSGSQGTKSFFSLNHVLRSPDGSINDIRELHEIYASTQSSAAPYVYRYYDDNNYYYSDGTLIGANKPANYELIFNLDPIRSSQTLTTNSVYYFEVPVDAGEFALGSAQGDGAYLIYLDIAANAQFDIGSTVTELLRTDIRHSAYPLGMGFVDTADSAVFKTAGEVDPVKSVFMTLPAGSESAGSTTFNMNASQDMTVNGNQALQSFTTHNIPNGGSLTVNGTLIESSGTVVYRETSSEIVSNFDGFTNTYITSKVQTIASGTVTTIVDERQIQVFGGNTISDTTFSAVYTTHEAITIPIDYFNDTTGNTSASAILLYTYAGSYRNDTLSHEIINIGGDPVNVTLDGESWLVYDITDAGDEGYLITQSGGIGTVDVEVSQIDNKFKFTINNTEIDSGTGTYTVAASIS
ncbi:MAG: hypothetical protein IKR08_02800 [Firmicutes bacterium]|nr:hypothetical protein [Bacillota bacterium]